MKKGDIQKIIESLEDEYPEKELEDLDPEEVYDMILELDLFDNVFEIDDEVLERVQRGWSKFREENN
jgi:FeS assembly protein IscX